MTSILLHFAGVGIEEFNSNGDITEGGSRPRAQSLENLDHEAEKEVLRGLEKSFKDPLAAYDLDTSDEAAALEQFLSDVIRLTSLDSLE